VIRYASRSATLCTMECLLRLIRRSLLVGLTLLLSISACAQDDNDGPLDDNDADAPAMLSLNFDQQGAVHASLTLPQSASDFDTVRDLLAQALHCPLGALTHPHGSQDAFPSVQENWSAARRERFRQQMADFDRRLLNGHCGGVLSKQQQLLAGDFDFGPALAELRRIGVDQLSIYVRTPRTQFRDYSRIHLLPGPVSPSTAIVYRVPLDDPSASLRLHLEYGLRSSDVDRAFAILAACIVLPVLATLWMRRRALALAKVDAAGAWFGFFRTLNWLMLGLSLLWLTSSFGARQTLEDGIASLGLSFWKAAVLDIAVVIVPAFLPYFVGVALSYPVHARLRGTQWTRREFLLRQFVMLGASAIPLLLGLSALGFFKDQPELAVGLLFLSLVVLHVLQVLKFRITRQLPQPLTTGELRDRIFALAGRLGVRVNQIFILSAGKGQVANAYAAQNRIVMFTDYLLEHLNKREVDAVAAHELAHLRHKHPGKRLLVFGAIIFLPFYFTWLVGTLAGFAMPPLTSLMVNPGAEKFISHCSKALSIFEQWSQRDFFLLLVGLTAFYFYSRHCENDADATAVRLTGDPEAQITGLLKLNRLNLVPIRWGKASESWLTHPSTVRRAHRIAAAGGLAPERLEEILRQYDSEDCRDRVIPPEDRYAVPVAGDPEKMRAAFAHRSRIQRRAWLYLVLHVLPLALVSILIQRMNLTVGPRTLGYLSGIVLSAVLVTWTGVWLGESGRDRENKRLVRRFAREHTPAGLAGDILVGFAPGPHPRIYGTRYHWDSGFLILAKDGLQFVGEEVKFSFPPSQIDGVVIGRGGPSWWKFERVYVRWKTEDGHHGIFNLYSLASGPMWKTESRVHELYRQVLNWRQQPSRYPDVRPELADLKKLELGQVTSISPARLGNWSTNLKFLAILLPLAIVTSMLMHAEMWYLILSLMALRVIESIPYWRYREVVPVFPPTSTANPTSSPIAATAAKAGQ
jgi:Zn-dependent protease with chaperone function